ncbi:MAG: hypothetical protein LBN02_08340 [Oscillospiraceae bacterium]|nr:hypothetical protein [Oscillospiraceae bacterium]
MELHKLSDYCVTEDNVAPSDDAVLQLEAAYSTLARVSGKTMLRQLIREPDAVHAKLAALTDALAAYITTAFGVGAEIISLSDPYAQAELIGEPRIRAFAAPYQLRLLKTVADSGTSGVLHVCPYSFAHLTDSGALTATEVPTTDGDYRITLNEIARESERVIIVGQQCPHVKHAKSVFLLEISNLGE